MRVSAKADYALRAMAQLAAEPPGLPVKADHLANAQRIPIRFLLAILVELKHARLVRSTRGASGGFSLSRAPDQITMADIVRAVEGPLVNLHDARVGELQNIGPARAVTDVWMAVRANVRLVLESVTLADVVGDRLPPAVKQLVATYEREQGEARGLSSAAQRPG